MLKWQLAYDVKGFAKTWILRLRVNLADCLAHVQGNGQWAKLLVGCKVSGGLS